MANIMAFESACMAMFLVFGLQSMKTIYNLLRRNYNRTELIFEHFLLSLDAYGTVAFLRGAFSYNTLPFKATARFFLVASSIFWCLWNISRYQALFHPNKGTLISKKVLILLVWVFVVFVFRRRGS